MFRKGLAVVMLLLLVMELGSNTIYGPLSTSCLAAGVEDTVYNFTIVNGECWQSINHSIAISDPQTGMAGDPFIQLPDRIAALDSLNGAAYALTQHGNQSVLFKITKDGFEQLFAIDSFGTALDMRVLDGYIAILWMHDDYHSEAKLYSFDGQDANLPEIHAIAMTKYSDSIYFVADEHEEYLLQKFRPAQGELMPVGRLGWCSSIAVPSDTMVYAISYGGITKTNIDSNLRSMVAQLSDINFEKTKIEIYNGEAYILDTSSGMMMRKPIEAKFGKSITLINCLDFYDQKMKRTIELLTKANPDCTVEFADLNEEALLVSLMAGEEGFDLLMLDTESAPRYIRAGVIANLREDDQIMNAYELWNDVYSAITCSDVLYGVPVMIITDTFQVNQKVGNVFGISKYEQQYDLEQIFALAQDIGKNDAGGAYLLYDNMYFPMFVAQYMADYKNTAVINFSDPKFSRYLEGYKQLVDKGLVCDMFSDTPGESAVFQYTQQAYPTGDAFYELPTLDGKRTNLVYTIAIGVNTRSKNKELALEFLRYYLSAEVQLLEHDVGYLEDYHAYSAAAAMSEKERKNVEDYFTYIENCVPQVVNTTFIISARDVFAKYYSGEISASDVQNQLQQKLDMMLNE